MKKYDISICIICHHDRGYLQEAMESAINQDFDGTYEIILQKDATKTMAQNTNEAVRRASGDFIKWLHDDDVLLPNCLQSLYNGRMSDVIMGNVEVFGDVEQPYLYMQEVPDTLFEFIEYNPINQAGCMYRRQVLLDNPLDESLLTAEEYELNLRLFVKNYRFHHICEPVACYRVHDDMKSGSSYNVADPKKKAWRNEVKEKIRNEYRKLL
jgi:glycosyltransferase involved in cell wall biosynthesis